jgi:hypothetical protein
MRWRVLLVVLGAIALFALRGSTYLDAQAPGGARAYMPPRTADGQPDLQGVWRVWNLAKYDLEDHGAKPGVPAGRGFVVDPPDGRIPYQPWALEKRRQNYEGTKTFDPAKHTDPVVKCYIPGIPRFTYLGFPFQIIQTPGYVLFSYEWSHQRRFIPLSPDAPLPEDEETWFGVGRAKFEGNSLVITLSRFNDDTWFDAAGNFHTNALRVVERYTPVDPDTLQYDVTIEDPKVFTRPWSIRMFIQRQKEIGILDYECSAMLDEQGLHHTWPRDFDAN